MTLPQFWFEPDAYLLEEMASEGPPAPPPKISDPAWLVPPGGACRRVEDRSEMKLLVFTVGWEEEGGGQKQT